MNKLLNGMLVAVFSLLLVACGGDTQPKTLTAQDYIKSPPGYAKPGAAISLTNSQVNLAVAGAQYAVDMDIDSAYDSGDMTLSVSTSEGLYIVGGDLNPSMTLSKGKINCPYNVIAAEPGRYYIYANAKVESGGKTFSRALTFIVQVGDEDKADDSGLSKLSGEEGEVILSMPAEEEIIQH